MIVWGSEGVGQNLVGLSKVSLVVVLDLDGILGLVNVLLAHLELLNLVLLLDLEFSQHIVHVFRLVESIELDVQCKGHDHHVVVVLGTLHEGLHGLAGHLLLSCNPHVRLQKAGAHGANLAIDGIVTGENLNGVAQSHGGNLGALLVLLIDNLARNVSSVALASLVASKPHVSLLPCSKVGQGSLGQFLLLVGCLNICEFRCTKN